MKLLHFTAPWCNPCKMMKPIVDDIISERTDIEYVSIDIDKNVDVALEYEVMGIPLFVLEREDGSITRIQGAMAKSQFIQALGI